MQRSEHTGFVGVLCATAIALSIGCGARSGRVTRIADGRQLAGRYISPDAYAAYSAAAALEVRRQFGAALSQYRLAAERDPKSVEIWTRIGSLECEHQHRPARDAFARAERLGATYAPMWRARAGCLFGQRDFEAALDAATRAVVLDPDATETSLLLARIHMARGERAEAIRWLRALGLRDPSGVEAWKLLQEIAEAEGNAALLSEATHAETAWRLAREATLEPSAQDAGPGDLDAALIDGDLPHARALALRQGVSPGDLALRAVAMGVLGVAAEQARLVLGANPQDSNARIAAMLVAARRQDHVALAHHVRQAAAQPGEAPSPLGASLLAGLIADRVGTSASRAFEMAYRNASATD